MLNITWCGVGEQKHVDEGTARAVAEERHSLGVSAEGGDVPPDPEQSGLDVPQSQAARPRPRVSLEEPCKVGVKFSRSSRSRRSQR